MAGNFAVRMGADAIQLLTFLQMIVSFYGILTIGIIYLILKKLPLSDFSRVFAFGAVCFLPRHIYMSAMNSNDSLSYLGTALCVYLLLLIIEKRRSLPLLLTGALAVSITLFTKYTAFVLLPVILIVLFFLSRRRLFASRKEILLSSAFLFLVPMTVLSTYMLFNVKNYGSPLPWNLNQYDPALHQPRDKERFDFFSFKPWEGIINTPILSPGRMHSYWTLVYNGMWFDTEPKFINFPNPDQNWWDHYYRWLSGLDPFPEKEPPLSNFTKATGSGLIAFGLLPLMLILCGFLYFLKRVWKRETNAEEAVKMSIFPVLLSANAAGMAAIAVRLPVYTAAKASYFLNSLPAFAVFLGLGLVCIETNKRFRQAAAVLFSILFALSSFHILHICYSLFKIRASMTGPFL